MSGLKNLPQKQVVEAIKDALKAGLRALKMTIAVNLGRLNVST